MTQSVPTTMQAVQIDQPGGKLVLRELPVPHPQAGQVLVRMAAAPINPSDFTVLSKGASYMGTLTYPATPGIEGSGTIVEAGAGLLPRLWNNRRVACSTLNPTHGSWAEYMLAKAQLCIPLNQAVSLEQGAMLQVNPFTALALLEIAQRGSHRAIVNTAAASALGIMLLRLGKRYQIPVIHIVRRQAQVETLRSLGAEYILDSSQADFLAQLQALASRLKATLFLDAIAGCMTQQLAQAAPFGSTILLYSNLSTQNSVIDPYTAFTKEIHVQGFLLSNWLRKKSILQKLQLSRRVQSLLATDLQSPVYKRFPLAEAQLALDTYLANMSAGKVLIVADPQQVQLES